MPRESDVFNRLSRCFKVTKIRVCTGSDDCQFEPSVGVQIAAIGIGEHVDGFLRPAAAAFGIGDDREVVLGTGDPHVRAKFAGSFVVQAFVVRDEAECFACSTDSACAACGGFCVFVGLV